MVSGPAGAEPFVIVACEISSAPAGISTSMRIPWESKALRWRAETAGRAPVEGMKKTLAGKLALTAFIVGGSELGYSWKSLVIAASPARKFVYRWRVMEASSRGGQV